MDSSTEEVLKATAHHEIDSGLRHLKINEVPMGKPLSDENWDLGAAVLVKRANVGWKLDEMRKIKKRKKDQERKEGI